MKKILYLFLIMCAVGSLSSCKEKRVDSSDYTVAVVETTSNVKKSKITYYNKELKEVEGKALSYAELGSTFNSEYYNDGEVYFVPRGMMKMHNEKKVISVNQKNKKITEYPIDRTNILVTAADDNYVYAGSNSGFTSYITQYNKENKKTKEISLKEEYVSKIICHGEKIYIFSLEVSPKSEKKAHIYIYNEKLELEKKVQLPNMNEESTYKASIYKNSLIFSVDHQNQVESNKLGVLDLKTLSISFVDLSEYYPDDIVPYKGKIIVSHTSLVQPQGTKISVIDWATKEQKVYNLETTITRIAVSGDTLYVLGENKLSSYDIANDFKLKNKKTEILSEGQYASSIFTKISPTTD